MVLTNKIHEAYWFTFSFEGFSRMLKYLNEIFTWNNLYSLGIYVTSLANTMWTNVGCWYKKRLLLWYKRIYLQYMHTINFRENILFKIWKKISILSEYLTFILLDLYLPMITNNSNMKLRTTRDMLNLRSERSTVKI